jgi:hypothetical protein
VLINFATVAEHPVAAAPGDNQRWVCRSYQLNFPAGTQTCEFKSAATSLTGPLGQPVAMSHNPGLQGYWQGGENEAITLTLTTTVRVTGHVELERQTIVTL